MHAMTTITGKELNRGGGNTVCLVSMMAMVKGRWGTPAKCATRLIALVGGSRAHTEEWRKCYSDFSMGRKVDNNSDMKERRKKSVKTGQCFLFMYLRLYCTALVVFVRVRLVGERRIDGQVDDGLQCGCNCN